MHTYRARTTSRALASHRLSRIVVRRAGFFHFVSDHHDPFGCLATALNVLQTRYPDRDIRGSLVVLPEAFNLGSEYHRPDARPGQETLPACQARAQLLKIAQATGILFVAGLLDGGLSSAYWIDPFGPPQLMCHKMGDDRSGNYLPWSGVDPRNPVHCANACIGALICVDSLLCATEGTVRERRGKLLGALKANSRQYKILCIPGHMSSDCMPEVDGVFYILANSNFQTSFIKDDRKVDLVPPPDRRNQICLADLSVHEGLDGTDG